MGRHRAAKSAGRRVARQKVAMTVKAVNMAGRAQGRELDEAAVQHPRGGMAINVDPPSGPDTGEETKANPQSRGGGIVLHRAHHKGLHGVHVKEGVLNIGQHIQGTGKWASQHARRLGIDPHALVRARGAVRLRRCSTFVSAPLTLPPPAPPLARARRRKTPSRCWPGSRRSRSCSRTT